MNDYISVGKILNFHGLKGEAKVGFSKNQEDFIKKLKCVFIKRGLEYVPYDITSIRFNKTFALLKFNGIDDINDIIPLKDSLLFVQPETIRNNMEEDEFLIDELTGLDVVDLDGKDIGVVVGVANNGMNDLIAVKSKTQIVSMVPFVKELVPTVDIKNKKIMVNNIKGLID